MVLNELRGDRSRDFKLGTVTVPDGECGAWRVSTFTLTDDDVRLENLRAIFSGHGFCMVRAGTYKRLTCAGRGVVMSNTDMEVRTHQRAFREASGRILVNGLGLGMFLEALLSKPDVTYIRVIELEPDVIKLVGTHFKDPRVEIICADAYEYAPAKGERFNYAWHDIWDDISSDNRPDMSRLVRKYARRVDKQGVWSRDWMRRK